MIQIGDLVINLDHPHEYSCGLVLSINVNMWGEEVIPTGTRVLWSSGEVETLYEDELEKKKTSRELTDEELSNIAGGMSDREFERWKISLINSIGHKQDKEK